MYMFLVGDVFLVVVIDVHGFGAMRGSQLLQEIVLELFRIVVLGVFEIGADDQHLPHVGLGLHMAFEAVLVSTLLLAFLAVPSKATQALGLHLVGDIFRGADFSARHGGVAWSGVRLMV